MNGNCHLLFGLTTGVALSVILKADIDHATLITSGCIIGSVFPDIDNPDSCVGILTKPFSTLVGKVSSWFGKTGSNHRGIFHDIAFYGTLLFFCLKYIPSLQWFLYGSFTHLFLDSFNPRGVRLLGAKVRLARVVSGSTESVVLTWFLIVTVIVGTLFFCLKF